MNKNQIFHWWRYVPGGWSHVEQPLTAQSGEDARIYEEIWVVKPAMFRCHESCHPLFLQLNYTMILHWTPKLIGAELGGTATVLQWHPEAESSTASSNTVWLLFTVKHWGYRHYIVFVQILYINLYTIHN